MKIESINISNMIFYYMIFYDKYLFHVKNIKINNNNNNNKDDDILKFFSVIILNYIIDVEKKYVRKIYL